MQNEEIDRRLKRLFWGLPGPLRRFHELKPVLALMRRDKEDGRMEETNINVELDLSPAPSALASTRFIQGGDATGLESSFMHTNYPSSADVNSGSPGQSDCQPDNQLFSGSPDKHPSAVKSAATRSLDSMSILQSDVMGIGEDAETRSEIKGAPDTSVEAPDGELIEQGVKVSDGVGTPITVRVSFNQQHGNINISQE